MLSFLATVLLILPKVTDHAYKSCYPLFSFYSNNSNLINMKFNNISSAKTNNYNIYTLNSLVGTKYKYSEIVNRTKPFGCSYRETKLSGKKFCIFVADDKLENVHECIMDINTTCEIFYNDLVNRIFRQNVKLFRKRWDEDSSKLEDIAMDFQKSNNKRVCDVLTNNLTNNEVIYYSHGTNVSLQLIVSSYDALKMQRIKD